MKGWRTGLAAIALCGALAPLEAAAQNLVTNGSFEGGSLAGWTLVESGPFAPGNCVVQSLTAGSTTGGFAGFTTPPAVNGTFVFMTDANQPGTCRFYQDVVLPANRGNSFLLTYAAGYNFLNLGGGPSGCGASVAVTTTAFTPIATGFDIVNGPANVSLATRAPLGFQAAPGSTVRVVLTAASCNGGPAGIMADNVALVPGASAVPALDDPAKIALALLLAASALHFLRKRANH